MKNVTRPFVALVLLAFISGISLQAQVVFSRFDFNAIPFTTASIGPNAISIDGDVVGDGSAIYTGTNCGATKGIDLVIPNTAALFDQPEMGMTFMFQKLESRSDFFIRGGTSFYQDGGELMISYRTTDGAGGFIDYGPYHTAFTLSEDGIFHEYTFIYVASTGIATVSVDGMQVWTQDGPDNRDLHWVGAPDPIVGTVMDGNCNGLGILDYAFFFIPTVPLPVEFESFDVQALGNDALLQWTASHEFPGSAFQVERSRDGLTFEQVGNVAANVGTNSHAYAFKDAQPGSGLFYYRILQIDGDGGLQSSDIQTATFAGDGKPTIQAWPNPVSTDFGRLEVDLVNARQGARLLMLDSRGSIVLESSPAAGGTALDISALSPGMYLLRCDCGGDPVTRKIIVRE
ncbi:MAG TPA: T9SS type A sorting domain-containing protein [Bacteroidia bacterium]|nr:T9SS type A sorting domain-containing protein [Bacteroidia bacterium]